MQPASGGRGGALGAEEGRKCSRRSRCGGGVFERHGAVQHGNRWRLLLPLLRRRGKDRAGPERKVSQLVVRKTSSARQFISISYIYDQSIHGIYTFLDPKIRSQIKIPPIFNPRRACAARVTVVVSCVCLSVRTRYSGSTRD